MGILNRAVRAQGMRADVALRIDGNARVITIPRPILTYLGWLPGERLIVELLEDRSVHVRPLKFEDIAPRARGRMIYDFTESDQT
jgi:antitoxin component of MazEF toxin-antitoxin module